MPRRRPRDLEARTALLIGASAAALAACAKVGEDVFNHESGPFDEPIRKWVLAHQNPAIRDVYLVITNAASPKVMIPATGALALWLWRMHGARTGGAVVIAPAIAVAIFLAAKRIYRRQRPAGGKRLHQLTYAFPSGHASASAAIFGTTAYILTREGMVDARLAASLAAAGALLVGTSRIYLDVHWTTDVLGGWSVGSLVAAFSAASYERMRAAN